MHVERAPRPAVEVVELEGAKSFLRVLGNHDDADILMLIAAAVEAFEAAAQVALITRQIVVTLDRWPGPAWFALPVAPVVDPDTVSVTADGQTFTGFEVLTGLRPVLCLTGPAPSGLVRITYAAGFGDTSEAVPQDIKAAIIDQLLPTYDQRGIDRAKGAGLSAHMARVVARYRRVAA